MANGKVKSACPLHPTAVSLRLVTCGYLLNKTLDQPTVTFGYNAGLADLPMSTIADRRSVSFAVSISCIWQDRARRLTSRITLISKERQDVPQS